MCLLVVGEGMQISGGHNGRFLLPHSVTFLVLNLAGRLQWQTLRHTCLRAWHTGICGAVKQARGYVRCTMGQLEPDHDIGWQVMTLGWACCFGASTHAVCVW